MLRIVGGSLRGRRLSAPAGTHTRPTSERVREALASVLASRDALEGRQVLDLYAGSGALAFEALSRGASHALLVEQDPRVVRLIVQNAAQLGLSDRADVVRARLGEGAVPRRLAEALPQPASLVFADPPYAEIEAATACLSGLRKAGLLAENVRIVLEHAHKRPPTLPAGFAELSTYRYGDSAARLWCLSDEAPEKS